MLAFLGVIDGADGGGRTHTTSRVPDFESSASANSATSASLNFNYPQQVLQLPFSLCIPSLYPVEFGHALDIGHAKPSAQATRRALVPRRPVALVSQGAAPAAVRQQRELLSQN